MQAPEPAMPLALATARARSRGLALPRIATTAAASIDGMARSEEMPDPCGTSSRPACKPSSCAQSQDPPIVRCSLVRQRPRRRRQRHLALERLSQLDHRHRVVGRPVVARDDVEVARAGDEGRRASPFCSSTKPSRPGNGARGVGQLGAGFDELGGGEGRARCRPRARRARAAGSAGGRRGKRRGHVALPAEGGEVAGDAADDVVAPVGQVDVAVVVVVDRVLQRGCWA